MPYQVCNHDATVSTFLEEFQKKAKSQEKVESISDMKEFVENYPQFKKMSGTVTKHVTVVGELSRRVNAGSLLQVSECEQEIVCQNEHNLSLQKIRRLLSNSNISHMDATRLVMLYALKYETHSNNNITGLMDALKGRGVPQQDIELVDRILAYTGSTIQTYSVFGTEAPSAAHKITKRLFQGLKEVENIYTQHTPHVGSLVEELLKSRLKDSLFPSIDSTQHHNGRCSEIVIFVVGGVTYEEAMCIHQLNKNNPGCSIILGGTTLHNTSTFTEDVKTLTKDVNIRLRRRQHHY